MPWPGASLLCALLLLSAALGPPGVSSEAFVGCLFSERLCLQGLEFCYDDNVFGRCLPETGNIVDEDLFKHDLSRKTLHELSSELKRLFALGYRWSHTYTQCRLQGMLYSIQHDLSFEPNLCYELVDQDLEGALRALEGEDVPNPKEVAIIKFAPSKGDPHGPYGDEVYYPPVPNEQMELRKIVLPEKMDLYDMKDPLAEYTYDKRSWMPPEENQIFPENYNTPSDFRSGRETKDFLEFIPIYRRAPPELREASPEDVEEFLPMMDYLNRMKETTEKFNELPITTKYRTLSKLMNEFEDIERPRDLELGKYLNNFEDEIPESRIYLEDDFGDSLRDEDGSGNHEEVFRELKNVKNHKNNNDKIKGLYTEGGVVYEPKNKDALNDLLEEYSMGFKRPERLDVKKPGPQFKSNAPPTYRVEDLPKVEKKEPRGAHPNRMHEIYDLDPDYIYINFKQKLTDGWLQGKDIISNISKSLNISEGILEHGRADLNELSFKVKPNKDRLNASEVARKLKFVVDDLNEKTGLEITSIGVGDKVQMNSIVSNPSESLTQFHIIIFTICSILGALLIGMILLIIIRRHVVSKEKLHGLARPDSEASKDYQDLCRARMATKQAPENTGAPAGRVTSLSKETEQSPSSRSSTSSWSEEPALHNMDISTGHMVLTYMEDHLRNKDRLEQEWVALCAYAAEPCETRLASSKENAGKNRYQEVLPYDHARVILNKLSNENGSDYINASSITDHDPRNPAYIATQGPLPHTAPDFWQLIWEQGAVVIVMLSRLTEGGAAMCHRYWPEEGSELYHTYEVHLVSEHIWCDDYLVRSFYLKNTRTSETRTVTQFHFLSWPESGVPSSTKALLEFRRKVNKSYRGRSCPIVVHCSDGAGRTGTYCLIDMVLSRMAKGAKEIDIAATLEHLRDQRPRMVATKQQFEFVLTAVAEEVHAILKALPPAPIQPEKEKEKEVK